MKREPYFVVITHKHGEFPELVMRGKGVPLMFDSKKDADATMTGEFEMAKGQGWKWTVVKLED